MSASVAQPRHYFALFAGTGWLAGIWLGSVAGLPLAYWTLIGLALVVAAAVVWQRDDRGLLLATLAAVALGAARFASTLPVDTPSHLAHYNGAAGVTVIGLVAAEPELSDTTVRLAVQSKAILAGDVEQPVEGLLLVRIPRFPAVEYGSTVRLVGDLNAPAAEADAGYQRYLARRGFESEMAFPGLTVLATDGGRPLMRALLAVKDYARETIQRILPEPQAALLVGILLGDDSGMPPDLLDDFRTTGMTHIIAISGFNIALIIAVLDAVSAPFLPRRLAAVLILVLIGLYAVLVGAGASVVRAAIMGGVALVGLRLLGRPAFVFASLLISAFVMTVVNPLTLWDVGFQLSFAATLGLVLFAGRWSGWTRERIDRGLGPASAPVSAVVIDGLVVTLAAQLLTLPLILYHFGRLPLASLPANLLVLPAQPPLMATGGLATLAGMVAEPLGRALGLGAWLFLTYTERVIQWLAGFEWASWPVTLSATGLLVVYGFIALATAATTRRRGEPAGSRALPPGVVLPMAAGLVLAALLVTQWALARPDGRLHVAFLDVGQGDATLIQFPEGQQVLVDGGHYPGMLQAALGEVMPFGDRSIDVVVATHPDADHVSGLVEVLERYDVGRLVTNGQPAAADPAFAALLVAAERAGVEVVPVARGDALVAGGSLRLDVLHPPADWPVEDQNEASVVLRLTYGETSVLLTGDAGIEAEASMLASGIDLQSDVLKAGHHGSAGSTGAPFLAAVAPEVVVISVGAENRFGHPAPAVLERVASAGAAVVRTDEMGTVALTADQERFWFEKAR